MIGILNVNMIKSYQICGPFATPDSWAIAKLHAKHVLLSTAASLQPFKVQDSTY